MELKLQPKQSDCYLSEATEILYGGAAYGGKSHLLRVASIAWSLQIPGLQTYLFRRVSEDLRRNHIEGPSSYLVLMDELLGQKRVKFNESKMVFKFDNGSSIFLCHCQYEKHLSKYQGSEIHVLMIDELTHFTEMIYTYLRGRVRLGGFKIPVKKVFTNEQGKDVYYKDLFPRIICASNPGSTGHNFVKKTFIDFAPEGEIKQVSLQDGGMKRQFIKSLLEDNEIGTKNDPMYEHRLMGMYSSHMVKALRYGDWDIVIGGMFDDVWDRSKHVIKSFKIPSSWYINRSFDWGSSKPFSVGWWAESDGSSYIDSNGREHQTVRGDIFRIKEWYGCTNRVNEGIRLLASEIAEGIRMREEEMGLNVHDGPTDNSIFDEENGNCIADDMEGESISWTRSDKSPYSRKNGWQKIRSLLKGAGSKEYPGLYIFENCVDFIRTVPILPRLSRDPDDIDTNTEDHIADETRYRLYAKDKSSEVHELIGY